MREGGKKKKEREAIVCLFFFLRVHHFIIYVYIIDIKGLIYIKIKQNKRKKKKEKRHIEKQKTTCHHMPRLFSVCTCTCLYQFSWKKLVQSLQKSEHLKAKKKIKNKIK